MNIEGKEKKKVDDFNIGFLITYASFGILSFLLLLIKAYELIAYFYSLIGLGILLSVIVVNLRNKYPYISMGMIATIFGPTFLIIKKNGEPFVDPYTENPKKKKSHYKIGFLLSIYLTILLLPVILFGYLLSTTLGLWVLIVMSIMLINIYIGVVTFFFQEKLRYISKGMIPLLLVLILLLGVGIWLVISVLSYPDI